MKKNDCVVGVGKRLGRMNLVNLQRASVQAVETTSTTRSTLNILARASGSRGLKRDMKDGIKRCCLLFGDDGSLIYE